MARNDMGGLRCALAWVLVIAPVALGADWAAYQADPARSGVSSETLAFPLGEAWVHRPAQGPRPAWPEPGKELHRMDFDYAPYPGVAGRLV